MAHKVTTELQTAEHKYIMSNIVIKNIKIHGPLASAHIYINMYDCSSSCSSNQRLPKKKKKSQFWGMFRFGGSYNAVMWNLTDAGWIWTHIQMLQEKC